MCIRDRIHVITNAAEVDALHDESPWRDGSASAEAAQCLALVGPTAADRALPSMIESLRKADSYSALGLTEAMLTIAFGSAKPPNSVRFPELTAHQRAVLTTLDATPSAWKINGNMSSILRAWGLPSWPAPLALFIEGQKTLDEVVALKVSDFKAKASGGKRSLLDRLRRFWS